MIGMDGIGFHAVGEMILSTAAPVLYEPVSRILSGGAYIPPSQIHTLGVDIIWDNEDEMIWDNGDNIGMEA
jgi:hypothetical protein